MAPKGVKRAAAAALQEPRAKQAFDPFKEYAVSRQNYDGAISVLQHPLLPEVGVHEDCRQMLLVAAPLSLCVPADQRHVHQRMTVEMIAEVAGNVEKRLEEAADAEQSGLEVLEASRGDVDSRAKAAEEELASTSEVANTRKQELDSTSAAVLAARRSLADRQEEQRRAGAAASRAREDQEILRSALEGPFVRLREGRRADGEAKALYQGLSKLLCKLKLDDSLVTALPSSMTKRPEDRGSFEKMVVEQLQVGMEDRIRDLGAELAAAEPEGQRCLSAVEQAEGVLSQATDAQQAAASELNLAQEQRRKAAAEMDAARSEVTGFEPRRKAAEDARNAKRAALDDFRTDCLAPLQQLQLRESKVSEGQQRDLKEAASVAGA